MSLHELAEDAGRIRTELEHRHRSRQNIERQKIALNSNINQAQKILDQALEAARRAQNEVTEAQRKVDEETARLRRVDESIQRVAEEELELAAQLRDLTQLIARESEKAKEEANRASTNSRSVRTYR